VERLCEPRRSAPHVGAAIWPTEAPKTPDPRPPENGRNGPVKVRDLVHRWWPVAIIGLGLIGMFVERRIALGPGIIVVIGFLLLADQQRWTNEDLFGPVLLIAIGLVVLSGLWRYRAEG
jgi:hypothetical protein